MNELQKYYQQQFARTSVPPRPSGAEPVTAGKLKGALGEALATMGLILLLLFSFSEPNHSGQQVQEGTIRYFTSLRNIDLADAPEAIAVNILILKPYLGGTNDHQ